MPYQYGSCSSFHDPCTDGLSRHGPDKRTYLAHPGNICCKCDYELARVLGKIACPDEGIPSTSNITCTNMSSRLMPSNSQHGRNWRTVVLRTMPLLPKCRRRRRRIFVLKRNCGHRRPSMRKPARTSIAECKISRKPKSIVWQIWVLSWMRS